MIARLVKPTDTFHSRGNSSGVIRSSGANTVARSHLVLVRGGLPVAVGADRTAAVIDAPIIELGTVTPAASPVGTMTVDVVHPPADWTVRHAAKLLDPSMTYWAYGGTRDNSWATGQMEFRLSDIDRLAPGQLLYVNQNGNVVGSMDQFEKAATTTC
jgi:hypothetical protein